MHNNNHNYYKLMNIIIQ